MGGEGVWGRGEVQWEVVGFGEGALVGLQGLDRWKPIMEIYIWTAQLMLLLRLFVHYILTDSTTFSVH